MSLVIDFSTSSIRSSVKYFELISAIVGTLYFYKFKKTKLKYFLYLLWYITFTEFFAGYMTANEFLTQKDEKGLVYNIWVVNLLYLIFFPMLFYIYYHHLQTKSFKKYVVYFFIAYLVVSIINWTSIQRFAWEWSETPFIFGSITLVITVIFYLIELLKSEKIIVFHKMLLFWISVGILLFHSGTIPFTLKFNGYALIPGIHELFLIIYILAILMYLIFTFGFIWSKKE